uniref:Phorbol-ester/DAG-type domain-containing protein n=1 Tax=Panagrolaimus davidi TaxID=227884 RepID=A0A914QVZ9_9BILA
MEACEFQFDAISQTLFTQELRMKQKALDDLKKDYEQLKIREQTLMEKTRWEQGRTKAQEDRVKSLNEEIEKLKEDYEGVIRERDNLKKEISALRRKSTDNTFRLQYESEIINYRTKIAGLESRLSRRQIEFDKSEEHMSHEIEKLQNLLDNTQIRLESSSASYSEKENLNSSSVEKLNDLHFKIGDLTATNKALRDEINRHVSEKSELQEEMKNLREEMESLKGTNNVLQERLTETEGSNDFASKYYTEELTKIKAQKAEIRCDLIRLRREHEKCLQNTMEIDVSKESHEKEVAEFKKKIFELESKLNETKRAAAENESSERGQIDQLTTDLKKANAAIALNQEALQTLDKQAEDLVKRVQLENASKKAAKKKVAELENEVKEFKRQMENKKMMEEEMATLKVENDKLLDKISYLENEIRETHTDHREELAKLAQQVTKARSLPSSDNRHTEELSKKVAHLEATIRQNENVARSLQRQIDQSKNEVVSAEKALSDMHEIAELRDELNQKEENIAYLQSIQQPRKLEKLKISNSQSTLVTGADDELEYDQLLATRNELARQVDERTKMLEKKKEEIVPLLKASSVCSESSIDINHTNMSTNSSRSRIGTMRHDIPHRWSKTFVAMFSPRCELCFEAIARFSYAHRCKSCRLVVHSHCKSTVLNTCGLPDACANFYHENHALTNDRISGW